MPKAPKFEWEAANSDFPRVKRAPVFGGWVYLVEHSSAMVFVPNPEPQITNVAEARDPLTGPLPQGEYDEPHTDYLRGLASRLFGVPVMYGTDQGDCDRLSEIAKMLENRE